jgi:hypothetical protein
VRIQRRDNGRNHWYVDLDTGEKIDGVTKIMDRGLPKKALINWAANATAEYAIDHWDELSTLAPSARLKRLQGGRYESKDEAANRGTQVHKLGERIISGEQVVVPDLLVPYVGSYVRFIDEFQLRAKHVEAVVYSETHRYVGTLDIFGDILLPDMPEYDHLPRDGDGFVCGCLIDAKGLALSTPIPTPAGWTTMSQLRTGDVIFDRHGQPCQVTGKSKIHLKPCRRLRFDDGSEIICDEDHRWLVRSGRSKYERWQVATVTDLANTLSHSSGRHQHRVPVAGPLELPNVVLPVDPYVFGAWLGDGTAATGTITKPDQELFDLIAARGYRVGPDISGHDRCQSRTVYGLRTDLRRAGLLGHKAVPDVYLRGSIEQRLDLLRGLMDTDGTVNKIRHQAVFVSVDKAFAYSVRELVHSLGERCNIAETKGHGFGREVTSWKVSWRPQRHNPFALHRKASLISLAARLTSRRRVIVGADQTLTVPTQCITVDSPDQTYLCGEQMIPTHNTNRSGIFGETALQLAGYRYAEYMQPDPADPDTAFEMPEVTWTGAVWIRPNGYSLVPVVAGVEQHRSFLYANQVGIFDQGARDLIGDPIEPPTASAYVLAKAGEES